MVQLASAYPPLKLSADEGGAGATLPGTSRLILNQKYSPWKNSGPQPAAASTL